MCLDRPKGQKIRLGTFQKEYGHEFGELTEEEVAAYLEVAREIREEKTTTDRKVHISAQQDIQATWRGADRAVSATTCA